MNIKNCPLALLLAVLGCSSDPICPTGAAVVAEEAEPVCEASQLYRCEESGICRTDEAYETGAESPDDESTTQVTWWAAENHDAAVLAAYDRYHEGCAEGRTGIPLRSRCVAE